MQTDLDDLQLRQAKRQEEEALQRAWNTLPDTQGAQRVMELLGQPEVRSRCERVAQTVNALQQWQRASEQLDHGATKLNWIRQVTQVYLDERKLPQASWQQLQEDLTQYQRVLDHQKQLEI